MFDGLKSSKLNFKREVKLGRRGGASWPLWVTEVSCELLVNGSPPSAIPSTIGTLFAMLYSEEPTSIPSLDYVRQCRVLVQIVSETITAMKLSICTNWAEICESALEGTTHQLQQYGHIGIAMQRLSAMPRQMATSVGFQ